MENKQWYKSKGKLGAVLYVVMVGLQTIPAAFGYELIIPDSIFQFLEAAGLGLSAYGIRSAINK